MTPEEDIKAQWIEIYTPIEKILLNKSSISCLWEKDLVSLANFLWMEKTTKEKKANTMKMVLDFLWL